MAFTQLATLIRESDEAWTVAENQQHLPVAKQEIIFGLEGIARVEGVDNDTLTGMLEKEFSEYDGFWFVGDSDDGTIEVSFTSEAVLNAGNTLPYIGTMCNPNYQAWLAAGQPEEWDCEVIECPEDYDVQVNKAYDAVGLPWYQLYEEADMSRVKWVQAVLKLPRELHNKMLYGTHLVRICASHLYYG